MKKNIKSTFPKQEMTKTEIENYLKNHDELIILATYAICSKQELSDFIVEQYWVEKNEYGGDFKEYWKIYKKI